MFSIVRVVLLPFGILYRLFSFFSTPMFPTTVTYSRHPVWAILARVAGMSPLEIRYLATNEDNLVTDLRLRHYYSDYLVVSCISHYLEGKRR